MKCGFPKEALTVSLLKHLNRLRMQWITVIKKIKVMRFNATSTVKTVKEVSSEKINIYAIYQYVGFSG